MRFGLVLLFGLCFVVGDLCAANLAAGDSDKEDDVASLAAVEDSDKEDDAAFLVARNSDYKNAARYMKGKRKFSDPFACHVVATAFRGVRFCYRDYSPFNFSAHKSAFSAAYDAYCSDPDRDKCVAYEGRPSFLSQSRVSEELLTRLRAEGAIGSKKRRVEEGVAP